MPNPSQRWQQNNIIYTVIYLFAEGKYVKCSENSLLPLWKVFQQRFLYRGSREFRNKKLSMFCVFNFFFMVFNLWLAAVVYHVYWTCKKFLTAQIPEMGLFTYETTSIAIFVLLHWTLVHQIPSLIFCMWSVPLVFFFSCTYLMRPMHSIS